jgi:glycosyltransferase involved in cell wall biosynthesis
MSALAIKNNITIVIPCRNEINYIGRTIHHINAQHNIRGTRIIIADGNSDDGTAEFIDFMIDLYKDTLKIERIRGGKVAYGRNKGAAMVKTPYILFMDADVILTRDNIINNTMYELDWNKLDLLTCKVKSVGKDIRTTITFWIFNIINKIISRKTPFAVGTYFLTTKKKFDELGGFDETLDNSEDYWLSKQYDPNNFRIADAYVGQDDRRFKKMGYFGMLKLIVQGYLNRNNIEFFKKDIGYWEA